MTRLYRSKKSNPRGYQELTSTCTDFGDSMFHSMRSKETDGWDYFELRRGHDSMITAPEELSRLLLKIISDSD